MSDRKKTNWGITKASLCSREITCMGQTFRPDEATAFVDFELAHGFPVVTVDNCAFHPQVVQNSYRSMLYKVFDLNHWMASYDQGTKDDHILGTILAVEFPAGGEGKYADQKNADGSWRVQDRRELAPGLRCVACMHKYAKSVPAILEKYFTGQIDWAVSMENFWDRTKSGFLIEDRGATGAWWEERRAGTPEDLRAQGWMYCAYANAPEDLREKMEHEQMTPWRAGRSTTLKIIALEGGLNGSVEFIGTGLTPMGKEVEAVVKRMLASQPTIEVNGKTLPDIFAFLRQAGEAAVEMVKPLKEGRP